VFIRPTRPTIEANVHKIEYEDLNQWIVPTKPEWFQDLLKKRRGFKPTFSTPSILDVASCPSFVTLFRNSYTLITISDMLIRPSDEYDTGFETLLYNDIITTTAHRIPQQMSQSFDSNLFNCKIETGVTLRSNGNMNIIFLPCEYEIDPFPLKAMTGIIPLPKNKFTDLQVNMWVDKRTFKEECFVPKGTPYAYLFFPEGRPKIKVNVHGTVEAWNNLCSTRMLGANYGWMQRVKGLRNK